MLNTGRLAIPAILVAALVFCHPLSARFGGGHTFSYGSGGGYSRGYSSGSGGYSSRSSGSSNTDGAEFLLALLWYFPELLGVFFLAYYTGWARAKMELHCRNIMAPVRCRWDGDRLAGRIRRLRRCDPNFSRVLFLDFARLMYTRWQECRATGSENVDILAPFLSESARKALDEARSRTSPGSAPEVLGVRDIIVGSARIIDLSFEGGRVYATVEFVSNYVEHQNDEGKTVDRAYVSYDSVDFRRRKDALSKPPEQMRALHCPSCGAPSEMVEGCCKYCGAAPKPGEDQWEVFDKPRNARRMPREEFDQERPADRDQSLPAIVYSPTISVERRRLAERDPGFSMESFSELVKKTFFTLQEAWSSLNWENVRHLMTASCWQANRLWIERYERTGLRNFLDDAEVLGVEATSFEYDAFYDTITVAVTARGKDYTIDERCRVVSGDRDRPVVFREYWTFIRRADFSEDTLVNRSCPNCGASVQAVKLQTCPRCGGLLESSEFDWTLAYVEQAPRTP